MKAIRIHEHGDINVLRIDELPEPQPSSRQVKIKIKASSLNHMDIWVRNGLPGIAALPLVLGCDGAGEVVGFGDEVSSFSIGQRVFVFPLSSCNVCLPCRAGQVNLCKNFKIYGEHQQGLHAEYVCIDQENVMPLDDGVRFDEAAAFPLAFLTAWHMLVACGNVKPGLDVLIMAGASGIGSAAIQIAKLFGARVITTVGGAEKVALAKSLGADEIIDHYSESISARVKKITDRKGVEIVFEHVGQKVWEECLRSLAWSGTLVTCGATSGHSVTTDLRHIFIKQQKIIGSTMGNRAEMMEIHQFIAAKKLRAVVDQVFPYHEVAMAHARLEASRNFGKLVLAWP